MAAVTASVATGVYVPPGATGTFATPTTQTSRGASTTVAVNFGTSTSQPGNPLTFLYYFIIPYLDAHVLSIPSWRYAYFFWIIVAFVTVVWSLAHQLKRSAGANPVSALLRKFFVRRVAWGASSTAPQPHNKTQWHTLTFGQLATVLAMTAVILALSLAGPDYLSPTTCTFGGKCDVQVFDSGPPRSTFTRLAKRGETPGWASLWEREPAAPEPIQRVQFIRKAEWKARRAQATAAVLAKRDVEARRPAPTSTYRMEAERALQPRASAQSLNPGGWAPMNEPLLAAPNYTIKRNMWTISSRLGLIAYAMLPLCVGLSLKMWPFALYATPWLTGYGYDKTGLLHRWMGRVVWALSTAHTITFALQLSWDYDPYGRMLLVIVWEYYRFNWGVVAYIALTLMVALSFNPLRKKYYEAFYYSHCVLTIVFLIGCIVHYEPLWAWATIAIVLWGAERGARLLVWLYINGFFSPSIGPLRFWSEAAGRRVMMSAKRVSDGSFHSKEAGRQERDQPYDQVHQFESNLPSGAVSPVPTVTSPLPQVPPAGASKRRRESLYAYGFQQRPSTSPYSADYVPRTPPMSPSMQLLHSSATLPPSSVPGASAVLAGDPAGVATVSRGLLKQVQPPSPPRAPPGFALAQLLPGRTVRLTVHTPERVRWRPGQSVLLNVPGVRWWQTHPYTIASVDPHASVEGGGSELVFLVRARGGFTKELFNKVTEERRALEARLGHEGAAQANGVMMRAQVSWPMGSAGRLRWEWYPTTVIVCGGSGVSFGIAVLEELCRRMAEARGEEGSGKPLRRRGKTSRVRFVWIVREHAHLAWVAPAIRRCAEMVTPAQLRIDIHVTGSPRLLAQKTLYDVEKGDGGSLAPPAAPFARGTARAGGYASDSECESEEGDGRRTPAATDVYGGLAQATAEGSGEDDVNLTEFDGETRHRTLKEKEVSAQVRKQGRIRRALSRGHKKANASVGGEVSPPSAPGSPTGALRRDDSWLGSDARSLGASSQLGLLGGAAAVRAAGAATPGARPALAEDDEVFIDVSEAERDDLDVVAELARTGKPRLGDVVDEESAAAGGGPTLVVCCGPLTLNNLMRKVVAERLGFRRTGLEIYTEEFGY